MSSGRYHLAVERGNQRPPQVLLGPELGSPGQGPQSHDRLRGNLCASNVGPAVGLWHSE